MMDRIGGDRIEDVNEPKIVEIDIPPWVVMALLGGMSGALSTWLYFSSVGDHYVVEDNHLFYKETGTFFAPGLPFGLALMIPFLGAIRWWWPKTALAMLICGLAHAVSMAFATTTALGPLLGPAAWALIVGKGLLVILGYPWRYRSLAGMMISGSIAGLLLWSLVPVLGYFLLFLSYPILGAAVAAPLGGLMRELRSGRSGEDLGVSLS